MNVLVLGGCGEIGIFGTKDLVESSDVSRVIIGDLNIEKAEKAVADIDSPKLSTQKVDINDHQGLVEAMKGVDVVLNYTGPCYNLGLKAVKAAIEAGRHYVDICDDYDSTLKMLALSDEAEEKGLTIIVGLGASPGLANVLARYGSDTLDQTDEIHISWVIGAGEPEGPGVMYHTFHMITGTCPQFLDGKLVDVPALSGEETVVFPDPIGECRVSYWGHPEPVTLSKNIKGVKIVTNKGGSLPREYDDLFKVLAMAGLTSPVPISVKGQMVSPRDLLVAHFGTLPAVDIPPEGIHSGLVVEVKGKKQGMDTKITLAGTGSVGAGTALAACVGAQMIAQREVKAKGVMAPEECIEPEKMFPRLAEKGLVFTETTTTIKKP